MNPCPGVLENIPPARDYEGGFACELMLKDLGIAIDSSRSFDASTPLGNSVFKIYN